MHFEASKLLSKHADSSTSLFQAVGHALGR